VEKVKTREEIFHDQVEAKKLEKQKKQKRQPKKDKNAGDYVESFFPEATYLDFQHWTFRLPLTLVKCVKSAGMEESSQLVTSAISGITFIWLTLVSAYRNDLLIHQMSASLFATSGNMLTRMCFDILD
jgi:hypothetical protein